MTSRWLLQTTIPVSCFIMYSGELAAELIQPAISASLTNTPLVYVTGINDPLIKPEKHVIVKSLMHSLGARYVEFDGGHEINQDVLVNLKELV